MSTEQQLTAEDIFASDDITISDPVVIPEWKKKDGKPGTLRFKVMTADDAIKFQDLLKNEATRKSVFVRLLAECACDENGNLLFKPADMERLRKKSSAVFVRLQKFLLQLNGMGIPEKSWEALREILVDAGVDQSVITLVQSKWEADDPLKNGSGGEPTSA